MSKLGKMAKRRLAKAVGRSPAWLKTVAVALPRRSQSVRGSFGPASLVISIDPQTGLPREPITEDRHVAV